MSGDNKRNLLYFEAPSMRALFAEMDEWQAKHRKRLQSVSVQPDGGSFAAIALSNPTEVIIVDGYGSGGVAVGGNVLACSAVPTAPWARVLEGAGTFSGPFERPTNK